MFTFIYFKMDFLNELAAQGLIRNVLLHLSPFYDAKLIELGHPVLDHAVKHDVPLMLERSNSKDVNAVILGGTLDQRRTLEHELFNKEVVLDGHFTSQGIAYSSLWCRNMGGPSASFIGRNFMPRHQKTALVAVLLPAKRKKLLRFYTKYATHLYQTFEQFQTENKGKRFVLVTAPCRDICMFVSTYNVLRIMSGLGGLAYSS